MWKRSDISVKGPWVVCGSNHDLAVTLGTTELRSVINAIINTSQQDRIDNELLLNQI